MKVGSFPKFPSPSPLLQIHPKARRSMNAFSGGRLLINRASGRIIGGGSFSRAHTRRYVGRLASSSSSSSPCCCHSHTSRLWSNRCISAYHYRWVDARTRTFASSSNERKTEEDSEANTNISHDTGKDPTSDEKEADTQPSTAGSNDDNDKTPDDQEDSPKTNIASINPARSLPFPWHYPPGGRLSRLDQNDDLSGLPKTDRARFVRKTLAAREMRAPWYQIFLTGSWERELADNFAWAFRRSVAGLLSKTFHVPMNVIDIDEDDHDGGGIGLVEIDTTATPKNDSSTDSEEETTTEAGDDASSSASKREISEADMEETNALVEAMLEENLLALYKNIDPAKVQIKFKMRPLSWHFESAFLIPMFTRDHVKRDPSLKGAYQAIETEFVESGSVAKVREMGEKLNKQTGGGGMRTLIAEVSVNCLETLQVYNAETGELIQGNVDEDGTAKDKEVQHLVRMEMATSRGPEGGRRLGSWQVTDIDDMLEGNMWH